MTYIKDQVIPSPIGMCSYEIIDLFLPSIRTDIFTNHHLISVGNEPCIGGLCVTVYLEIMRIWRYLLMLQKALIHEYYNDKHSDTDGLKQLRDYVCEPSVTAFFRDDFKFQRKAVRDWNETCAEVTLSYNMGFFGVREDSLNGAALVILDMLPKFGVLVYKDDGPGGYTIFLSSIAFTVLVTGRLSRIPWHLPTS